MITPNIETPRFLRVGSLVLSILASTLIFGSVAIGLTWETAGQIPEQSSLRAQNSG